MYIYNVTINIDNTTRIADAIYTGGDVITMNDAQPTAEAVAIVDGVVLYERPGA